jgi:hypothetical protein
MRVAALGFVIALYAFLVTFWRAAWFLFLIGGRDDCRLRTRR